MQSDIELGLLILHFFVSKLLQVANLSKQLVNEILNFGFLFICMFLTLQSYYHSLMEPEPHLKPEVVGRNPRDDNFLISELDVQTAEMISP